MAAISQPLPVEVVRVTGAEDRAASGWGAGGAAAAVVGGAGAAVVGETDDSVVDGAGFGFGFAVVGVVVDGAAVTEVVVDGSAGAGGRSSPAHTLEGAPAPVTSMARS